MRVAVVSGRVAAALVAVLALLAVSDAHAQAGLSTLEESSRITLMAGWQRAANHTEFRAFPQSNGGPLGALTFGYSPFGWGELGIDLFAGGQPLWKDRSAPWGASYGALVGGRLQLLLPGGPLLALIPRVGVHVGPAIITGPDDEGAGFVETLGTALAGSAGLEARLSPEWSLNLEYRYLVAQGVAALSGGTHVFNSGGHTLLLGATFSFLPGTRGTWGP